jgi:RHH-type proline utilization regulon transcriptional repressor/proline dehydrogenase/delta 1-pyrroline-5-carboxylate dehydrogenase
MCLAEALLRILMMRRDALIRDKVAHGDWRASEGDNSLFVNAATWGLVVAGSLVGAQGNGLGAALTRLIARAGEPVIRAAMVRASA